MTIDHISSEESGSEGSDDEARVFIVRPLDWRSPEAQAVIDSLDRKASRHRSERAKEMMTRRKTGAPSSRMCPESPKWAICATDK